MANRKPQPQQLDPNSLRAVLGLVKPSAGGDSLIKAIEKKRNSRVISLVYNELSRTGLAPPLIKPLEGVLGKLGEVERLDLFLRSNGGVAEIPWRVVSLLREFSNHLGVIVSGMALSGATHIAIAGDDLIMTPFATLGPVDPTRNHALLPKDKDGNSIPTSVQDLKDLIEFLKEQLGEAHSDPSIVTALFEKVHPLAIGAIEQSYNLSKLITEKVLKTRKKELTDKQIEKVKEALASKYFSHGFYISRNDVETDLGLEVLRPDDELSGMIKNLQVYYSKEFERVYEDPNHANFTARVAAFLQTTEERWVVAQVIRQNQLLADPWIRV